MYNIVQRYSFVAKQLVAIYIYTYAYHYTDYIDRTITIVNICNRTYTCVYKCTRLTVYITVTVCKCKYVSLYRYKTWPIHAWLFDQWYLHNVLMKPGFNDC